MSRTKRFLGAVSVFYLTQIVLTVAGLVLTPFLLHRVGAVDYGLWLVALQVTTYLSLLDLGVVALLPREVAYAVGRSTGGEGAEQAGDGREALRALVGRITMIVLWQMPIVAAGALGIFLLMPAEWSSLRAPMGVILLTFVLLFPSRILHGVLTGLQDQTFAGWLNLACWVLSTLTMVGLVLSGAGLVSLAANWLVSSVVAAIGWWARLRYKFPWALPALLPRVTWAEAREYLGRSVHASISTLAVTLIAGTDMIIIGKILGPLAVVPYAMTGKLIAVMANQPQVFMQVALPGLAELRAGDDRGRVYGAASALGQALLTLSGALCCLVLLVNRSFVHWWVGPSQYGGTALTAMLVLHIVLRHWNSVLSFTTFALGGERRLSYVTLADGGITVSMAVLLIWAIGPIGAPIAGVVGVCVVSLPHNLRYVARDLGRPVWALLQPLAGWAVRLVPIAIIAGMASAVWPPPTFIGLAIASIAVLAVYGLVMAPTVLRPPLGGYLRPRLAPLMARLRPAPAGDNNA